MKTWKLNAVLKTKLGQSQLAFLGTSWVNEGKLFIKGSIWGLYDFNLKSIKKIENHNYQKNIILDNGSIIQVFINGEISGSYIEEIRSQAAEDGNGIPFFTNGSSGECLTKSIENTENDNGSSNSDCGYEIVWKSNDKNPTILKFKYKRFNVELDVLMICSKTENNHITWRLYGESKTNYFDGKDYFKAHHMSAVNFNKKIFNSGEEAVLFIINKKDIS